MSDALLIGIDAGTSVLKAVVFTPTGEQLAIASLPNSYATLPNGGVEQDMARTWRDCVSALKELSSKVQNLALRVAAIAVTGQGDGTWLIDKDGAPVGPAFLWLDARAAKIAENYVRSDAHAAHYARTGTGVSACQMHTHLAWLKQHEPDVLKRATTAFHCKDWLYYNLTDQRATDPSEGNFTFGDFKSRSYQADILDELGVGEAKLLLPPMIDGTVTSHALSAAAARACDLKADTPVVLGYVDVLCGGLGGGLYDPKGRVGCSIAGSTGMHMRIVPKSRDAKLNTERSGFTMAFPVPDMVAQMQSNMASTLNIDWWLDVGIELLRAQGVEKSRADLLKGMDERVIASKPAHVLYHPYISAAGERGPFMDPSARAMLTGLDKSVGYFAVMRGVFEGLCYAARDCYAAIGGTPSEVRLTGGAARSAALRSILASVLNANVRQVSREESGAAGVAMIAAVQQKIYPDMNACADVWVTPQLGAVTKPDPQLVPTYSKSFDNYVAMRKATRPLWRGMQS